MMQKTVDVLTHEEFWVGSPPPGTRYVEVRGKRAMETVVASHINVDTDDPDDVVQVQTRSYAPGDDEEVLVVVLEWGSWGTEEAVAAKAQHDEAVASNITNSHVCSLNFDHKNDTRTSS